MLTSINHKLENLVSSQILVDEPLKKHTSFGIGGCASFYIFPNTFCGGEKKRQGTKGDFVLYLTF